MSLGVCVCVLILLTHSSHGKSNAIDSLSQESDQTVYQAGWIRSGEGWGSEELNILHHTLHGVDPESHAQSIWSLILLLSNCARPIYILM